MAIFLEFESQVWIYNRFTKLTVTSFWPVFNGKYLTFTKRLIRWASKIEQNNKQEPLGFPSGNILHANDWQFLDKIVLLISTLENEPSVKRGLNLNTFENALIGHFVIFWEWLISNKNIPCADTKLTKQRFHKKT